MSQSDDDLEAVRLWNVPLDLYAMFAQAEALSARHAQRHLSRSLDLLHVASALELGCKRFVALDTRQAQPAVTRGLKNVNLTMQKPPSRRA